MKYSLRTQTYFRLSLVSAENNVCEPEPGNDFGDVGILSQSQFSSTSPRTTARGIRCEDYSSFILSWNLIGQRETNVITSQKSFPGSGSQTLFSAETSDSRKHFAVRRLHLGLQTEILSLFGLFALITDPKGVVVTETINSEEKIKLRWSMFNLENNNKLRTQNIHYQ